VRDLHFAWFLVVLSVVGAGGYVLRMLFGGRVRHERTEADGGSVLLRKPFMEGVYWMLEPLVGWLAAAGATPNAVTLFSLLPAFLAGVALANGWFALGALLATMAQFADILDGLLARKLGMASDAGEVIDAAVDRYVELFFLGGLAVHYRSHPMLLVVLAALGAAFMVSYSTAKAEAMGVKPPRGAMRHAERGTYLLLGAGLTPFAGELFARSPSLAVRELPIVLALVLVAVVGNLSVARRFAAVARELLSRQRRPGQPAPAVASASPSPSLVPEPGTPPVEVV